MDKTLKPQHKDTLFRALFKDAARFVDLLAQCSLRAVPLTPNDLVPFDLESEVAQRVRRNDVSFLTRDNRLIILVEHQTTINPNMALRLFLYFVELLQLWIKATTTDLFGPRPVGPLPVPEFYVAYNGTAPLKDTVSSFSLVHEGIHINVTVNIVDIRFHALANTAPGNTLAGYAYLYQEYDRHVQAGMRREDAFAAARAACIAQHYLAGVIEKEDYIVFYKDFMDHDKQLWSEGRNEGAENAIQVAAQANAPMSLLQSMAEKLGITPQRLDELLSQPAG